MSTPKKPRVVAWSLEHDPALEERAQAWAAECCVIVAADCEELIPFGRDGQPRWTRGLTAWVESKHIDGIVTADGRLRHPDCGEAMEVAARRRGITIYSLADPWLSIASASPANAPLSSQPYDGSDMAIKLLNARKYGASKGFHNSGPAPYGYRRGKPGTKDTLTPHPEEAELVRRIFRLYLSLRSIRKITNLLRDEGLRTRRKKRWSIAGVAWILKNDTYIGRVHFGEIRAKGQHPPIVAPIVFNNAQALMRKNNLRGGKTDE